jgi:hypothetical protein
MSYSVSSLPALPDSRNLVTSAERRTSDAAASGAAAWAPLVAAMLLDVADFLSLGPQGVVIGLLVGTALGWRVAATSGLSAKWRLASAAAAAVYCMLPGTELVPLASVLTTALRVRQLVTAATGR